jgi:nickel transport protein
MKNLAGLAFFLACSIFTGNGDTFAHSINYRVEEKGIAVRAFYAEKDPASYSQYEIWGPGDKDELPHQTGRTDKNGFLSFVPDRTGTWKIRVWGESSHGFHGFTTEVKVDKSFGLESFSKPLVAAHTKLITGLSVIFGLFGIYAFLRSGKNKTG